MAAGAEMAGRAAFAEWLAVLCALGAAYASVIVGASPVLAQVAGALAAGASVALGWRLGYRRDWRRLVPAALAGAPRASTLTRKWKVTLGGTGGDLAGAGDVSYPVIAGGRVFVTVENTQTYGTHLYALNASTGAKDWSVGLAGTYGFSALAYNGRAIFALNYDGAADRVLGQHRA